MSIRGCVMRSFSSGFRLRFLAQLVLGLAILTQIASCGKRSGGAKAEEAAADTSVPVEAVPVSRRSISASYSGTATLEPESEAQVAAKVSGVLLKLLVEEGDQVKAGQVLAKLDDENPRLNRGQGAGDPAQARERLPPIQRDVRAQAAQRRAERQDPLRPRNPARDLRPGPPRAFLHQISSRRSAA